jgi:hypothetical protein
MVYELCILEECGHDLIEVPYRHFLGETEENDEPVRIADIPAEIRDKGLQNTSLEPCH